MYSKDIPTFPYFDNISKLKLPRSLSVNQMLKIKENFKFKDFKTVRNVL